MLLKVYVDLAHISEHADVYFQIEAQKALDDVIKTTHSDKIVLDIQRFGNYLLIIQVYMIQAVIHKIVDFNSKPTFNETDRILSLYKPTCNPNHDRSRRYIWRKKIEILVDRTDFFLQPPPILLPSTHAKNE